MHVPMCALFVRMMNGPKFSLILSGSISLWLILSGSIRFCVILLDNVRAWLVVSGLVSFCTTCGSL